MTNQQSGLRFDIYERVQLHEGVAPIQALEGVELAPHIQVLPQGEQAVLRGNLLLSATYLDEENRGEQLLEHLIPVEITLPLSRVQRVEDIAVEIENFDVDLLSSRSLNITGVLSLHGVEIASEPEAKTWREEQEEIVFVAEAEAPAQRAEEPVWQREAAPLPVEEPQQEQESAFSAWTTPSTVRDAIVEKDNEPEAQETAAISSEELHVEADPVQAGAEEQEEAVAVSAVPAVDEKKEMKIAFGSKNGTVPVEAPAASKPYGLTSLISKASGGKFEARSAEAPSDAAKREAPVEKVEWKKLLLSSMNEAQEFRRVRMYIVQKDDTLETIAKRYELNPREIALFNRLGESQVAAGQIVYIPKQ